MGSYGRKLGLIVLVVGLALAFAGCGTGRVPNPDPQAREALNSQLRALLPEREGYQWLYNGYAEYGHTMVLDRLDQPVNDYRYHITGEVHDMSGGESDRDFRLRVTYRIKDGIWFQDKSEQVMLDSDFDSLELLRAPVAVETAWSQPVRDKAGAERELDCRITGVRGEPGQRIYSVLYQDRNSDYYEKREMQEGIGVVSFEKLWITPELATPIGYTLFPENSGYLDRLALDAYLPPRGVLLRYFGLAEYGHQGMLQQVSTAADRSVYQFDGEMVDGSGLPGTFKVQYTLDYVSGTVTETVLENTRTNQPELNSRLHDPVILKLPIQTGTRWRSPVRVNGAAKTMEATIIRVELGDRLPYSPGQDASRPIVTVRYTVDDMPGYFRNTYIEERRFQAGRGLIGFSNLFPGDLGLSGKDLDDPVKVDQAYLNHLFGYSLAIE